MKPSFLLSSRFHVLLTSRKLFSSRIVPTLIHYTTMHAMSTVTSKEHSENEVKNSPSAKFIAITPSLEGYRLASEMLHAGDCVAFPTETVYGLGANAFNVEAVKKVFQFKGRPFTDPLIVHVPSIEYAEREIIDPSVSPEVLSMFRFLGSTFWPGPLTLIMKSNKKKVPNLITANTGFVGIRIPKSTIAMQLLETCQLPVAAPSANRFGHVSPTRAVHVMDDLGMHPIGIILGETSSYASSAPSSSSSSCNIGIESTVVKIESLSDNDGTNKNMSLSLYRKGGVSLNVIKEALVGTEFENKVEIRVKNVHSKANTTEVSPGQLLTHYAPDIPTYLVKTINSSDVSSSTPIPNVIPATTMKNAIVIDFGGVLSHYVSSPGSILAYCDLSKTGDVEEARSNLFEVLRWAEQQPAEVSPTHPTEQPWVCILDPVSANVLHKDSKQVQDDIDALRDRIYRAASGVERILIV
jgi:L-threonylcarbamoyladenylate synthase